MQEVTLMDVLNARERRAFRQRELLKQYGRTLICFTMNIAGPIKTSPLILKGYLVGLRQIRMQLRFASVPILYFEEIREKTGYEAFFSVDGDATEIKKLMCAIEQNDVPGRLFDIDVLRPDGSKIERTFFQQAPRRCLICEKAAVLCGSQRAHTVAELQKRTREILESYFVNTYANRVAADAVQSLLYEVAVTPKPGLVDRANNGSHKDMDFFTFMRSASCLESYFRDMVLTGIRYTQEPAEQTMSRLQFIGKEAELHMLEKTDGVNTHKGAVFSMGILCGALGRLYGKKPRTEEILSICGDLAQSTLRKFMTSPKSVPQTAGQRFYRDYGITGIRGEVAMGFPSVRDIGLPLLRQLMLEGYSEDEAGGIVLLHLMAEIDDTNMIARSDLQRQQQNRNELKTLLNTEPRPSRELLHSLNLRFMEENLSPGGCADMLAICWMLWFTEQETADEEELR